MPNQGFRFDFKMFLEGVEVPFKSASVASTPGGTMASINIYSNKFAHDLLPKTSVQIFFKEWVPTKQPYWYLMFDGSISNVTENESSAQGRMLSIEARDFITDLNKIPAALVWDPMDDLKTFSGYSFSGVFKQTVVPNDGKTSGTSEYSTRTFTNPGGGLSSTGLLDLSEVVRWVAGGAQGGLRNTQGNGQSAYEGTFGPTIPYSNGDAEGGLFLDAFARGIWMDSVGGTSMGAFMNKRLRVDKKLIIPKNKAGYNMFKQNEANVQIGSYLMGNARFTSVAASIMRMAGIFSARLFNVSAPSAIYIGDDSDGNPSRACEFIIDARVREFLVKENSTFGGNFILNEAMLIPPLEFTAPPDCNLIFPSMYDNIYWKHDYDIDMTRGMFKQADLFSNAESNSPLKAISIQVPNAIFDIHGEDEHGRKKPPLTYEERLKGVNPYFGSVSYKLGLDDVAANYRDRALTAEARAELNAQIAEMQATLDGIDDQITNNADIPSSFKLQLADRIAKKRADLIRRAPISRANLQKNAVSRHALIKYLNVKYSGRILQVGMVFNPYVMAGFPSVVFAGKDPSDKAVMKDMIGQVQQVQHDIQITSGGADATTSIVLNGARFVDEPTDMDAEGNPLFSKATDEEAAEIDNDTWDYKDDMYSVTPAESGVKVNLESTKYDLDYTEPAKSGFVYAKDLLTLTSDDKSRGESNNQYLDEDYNPNRIAKFYKDSMGVPKSFMVGGDLMTSFMYDTIHEGVNAFKADNDYIYHDYEKCLERVHRYVCTADIFYGGILGATVEEREDNESIYVVHKEPTDMQHNVIRRRYYGVSTDEYDTNPDVSELKEENGGRLTGAGKFSSILESMPVTAFIQERRTAVEIYLSSIEDSANHTKSDYKNTSSKASVSIGGYNG